MSKTPSASPTPSLSRRTVFAGAGTAGALAAAAALVPGAKPAAGLAGGEPLKSPDLEAGGYQVTEHVLRYYATARV